VLSLLKQSAVNWVEHHDSRLGAALAYYSIFSVAPVLIIAMAVATFFLGDDFGVRNEVTGQIRALVGNQGAEAIQSMLESTGRPQENIWATVIGIGALVFAAVGVVVQLKDALNTVWEVDTSRERGIWPFVRTYIVSAAGILALGFLLLVSLVLTAVVAAVGKQFPFSFPETVLQVANFVFSFVVITALFAMMFKWLPDAPVAWRDALPGAALTAAAFDLGKLLIGIYVGKQGLESTFGAAASLVVILLWVYYSAQIVLFGGEFTRVHELQRKRQAE
jgi:membrane protein